MLKQSTFFNKLEKKKLTVVQYQTLYRLHSKPEVTATMKERIRASVPSIYLNMGSCTLSDIGNKLIKEIDMIFKPYKKLKNFELLGDDFKERITEYIEIFPTGKLPSDKYARGNKKNIEENFMWFFQEFDYSWDQILYSTETYVEEYRKKNYLYMQTAMYFIKKTKDNTTQSELANYCDIIESGDDFVVSRTIKSKVV